MSLSKYENMWKLMSKHVFVQDPDTVDDKLLCDICKNLMIDACHSTCGCQYCHKCISDYLRDGGRYCPGGKDACMEEMLVLERDVMRNRGWNIKISKLKMSCPNVPCQIRIELIKMEEHLRLCIKQSISCPYNMMGCEEEDGPRDAIVAHLYDGMMTHSTLLVQWILNLKNDIVGLKNKVDRIESELSAMKGDLEIKDSEMCKLNVEVEHTKDRSIILENILTTLEQESNDNNKRILTLEEEVDNYQNKMAVFDQVSTDNEAQILDLKQQISALISDNAAMREELTMVKDYLATNEAKSKEFREETLSIMSLMKEESNKMASTEIVARLMEEGQSRVDKLEATIWGSIVTVGAMKVTVDRFSDRKNEEIISPYFYSHNNGYKLRLIIRNPSSGWGVSYLYVSLIICKGEYDDLLQWPCKYSFDVSIVNQHSGGTAESVTVNYANIGDKYKFNKPIKKDNDRYNCISINYNHLRSLKGAIHNNSLIINCIVHE